MSVPRAEAPHRPARRRKGPCRCAAEPARCAPEPELSLPSTLSTDALLQDIRHSSSHKELPKSGYLLFILEWISPDWSLIRSFLAVAEAGSLSAAARGLGLSQPTLGRHISRTGNRAWPCPCSPAVRAGPGPDRGRQALLPAARAMRDAAARAGPDRRGRSGAADGRGAHHRQPDRRRTICCRRSWPTCGRQEPGIEIDLVALGHAARTCCSARPTSRCGCIARRSSTSSPAT